MIRQVKNVVPWWTRNGHVQSILGVIKNRFLAKLSVRRQEFILPDGDFIDICWSGKKNQPIVVLIHGLEASTETFPMRVMTSVLNEKGFRVVGMNLRTCSGRMNRKNTAYHAGQTSDIKALIEAVHEANPGTPMFAVGFSVGGNMLLHYLSQNTDSPLTGAVAVSVPYDIRAAMTAMPKFYEWRFVKSLKMKFTQKVKLGFDIPISDISAINKIETFHEMNDKLIAPLHGFSSVDEYYKETSSTHVLKDIETESLLLHAADDPVIPKTLIPNVTQLSDKTSLEISAHGGHLGFIHDGVFTSKHSWLQERIPKYFNDLL